MRNREQSVRLRFYRQLRNSRVVVFKNVSIFIFFFKASNFFKASKFSKRRFLTRGKYRFLTHGSKTPLCFRTAGRVLAVRSAVRSSEVETIINVERHDYLAGGSTIRLQSAASLYDGLSNLVCVVVLVYFSSEGITSQKVLQVPGIL